MQLEVKYKPRIAIDARPLSYGLTGNSRYLFEVLKYLIRKDSHFEYYLYSNKEIHPMFMDFIKDNSVQVPIVELRFLIFLFKVFFINISPHANMGIRNVPDFKATIIRMFHKKRVQYFSTVPSHL